MLLSELESKVMAWSLLWHGTPDILYQWYKAGRQNRVFPKSPELLSPTNWFLWNQCGRRPHIQIMFCQLLGIYITGLLILQNARYFMGIKEFCTDWISLLKGYARETMWDKYLTTNTSNLKIPPSHPTPPHPPNGNCNFKRVDILSNFLFGRGEIKN